MTITTEDRPVIGTMNAAEVEKATALTRLVLAGARPVLFIAPAGRSARCPCLTCCCGVARYCHCQCCGCN